MNKKNITIENLATIVKKGFNEAQKDRKKMRTEMEDLAIITKRGFDEVDERFKNVDKRFDGVDKRLTRVEITMVTKDYLDEKMADLRGGHCYFTAERGQKVRSLD